MTTKVPARVQELRSLLQTKRTELDGMSASWKIEHTPQGEAFDISTEQKDLFQKAVNEATEIKELLILEEKAAGIGDFLDAPQGVSFASTDTAAAQRGLQVKSLADQYLESDVYTEMKASGFRQLGGTYQLEAGIPQLARAAQVKDVYSAMGGSVQIPTIGAAQSLGWTERTLRPGRVRDLFPSEQTQAAILYGIRETGYTNRARTVPQRTAADGTSAPVGDATDVFGLKPKSELTIVPVTYPISTIAHIMYVHKDTLADEPRMRGLLDRDMIDGVKMAEDEQLLYGDGIGSNLTGLVNTTGIQTYNGDDPADVTPPIAKLHPNDKRSAQIRRAATRAMLAYFQPTGVVLHPFDWEDIELETDANGAYTVAVSVAVGGEKRVWRMNVVDSPAMQQGKYLVGAFGTGAKVYDREQVNVQLSTENRDLFERNAVTLRAEERLGLVVDRPESFVYGTFFVPAA